MSLFSEFQQGEIIADPKKTGSAERIRKERVNDKKKEEEAKRKELAEKMRLELSPEEYKKRKRQMWYNDNRERHIQKELERQRRLKEEQDALIEEIYKEIYDPLPEPVNRDKYYLEKFKSDNTNSEGKYKFGRWKSRIRYDTKYYWRPLWKQPVRIITRKGLPEIYARTQRIEQKTYEYIKPYIDKIDLQDFWLAKEQIISKYPLWHTRGLMRELCDNTDIPKSHICNIASAILRDKYITSEAYLGHNSFIIGDAIVTQTGALFPISLDNNLPRLTKDTVEQYHNMRIAWHNDRNAPDPPIYRLTDAYLLKIPINEWEDYWYVVPFENSFISKE